MFLTMLDPTITINRQKTLSHKLHLKVQSVVQDQSMFHTENRGQGGVKSQDRSDNISLQQQGSEKRGAHQFNCQQQQY